MRPFDLESAKRGEPVCTRDGRSARIVCFDAKGVLPIIALVECSSACESVIECTKNGEAYRRESFGVFNALVMAPRKRTLWGAVLKVDGDFFASNAVLKENEQDILNRFSHLENFVRTFSVEVEE